MHNCKPLDDLNETVNAICMSWRCLPHQVGLGRTTETLKGT